MSTQKTLKSEGVYTSEFWLTVLVIVAATVLRALGDISEDIWAIAIGVQGGAYSLSRGISKVK